jgi:hypothetical protein
VGRIALRATSSALYSAVVLLTTHGCASLLGVDDYQSVASVLCSCPGPDQVIPCSERVEAALSGASVEVRETWFKNFQTHGCDLDCSEAKACFDAAPTCTPIGDPCTVTLECCGAESPEEGFYPSYCDGVGRCVQDTESCRRSFEICSEDRECCGNVAKINETIAAGTCDTTNFDQTNCIELCDPDDPAGCPGCCASINFTTPGGQAKSLNICVDAGIPGLPALTCDKVCQNKTECPSGQQCTFVPLPGDSAIRLCSDGSGI